MVRYLDVQYYLLYKFGKNGLKHRVQLLLDAKILVIVRGMITLFVRDPALIFKAVFRLKYKKEESIGGTVLYGA